VDEQGSWRPSPAYDLTFTEGPGGEHTTMVAGEGRAPTTEHLLAVARDAELKPRSADEILDEVRAAIARFERFAERAGVPVRLRRLVAARLGRSPRRARGRSETRRLRPRSR
jgi:serine/threonine-protein kinase HipA